MAKANKDGSNKGRGGQSQKRRPPAGTPKPGRYAETKGRGSSTRGVFPTKEQAVREARRRGGAVVEHRPSGKVLVHGREVEVRPEQPYGHAAPAAPVEPRPTTHVTRAPGGGWRVESRRPPSAAKAAVQRLVDELPEADLDEVASFLAYLRWRAEARRGTDAPRLPVEADDRMRRVLRDAPLDDEPTTAEEDALAEEGWREYQRGDYVARGAAWLSLVGDVPERRSRKQ